MRGQLNVDLNPPAGARFFMHAASGTRATEIAPIQGPLIKENA